MKSLSLSYCLVVSDRGGAEVRNSETLKIEATSFSLWELKEKKKNPTELYNDLVSANSDFN